MPAPTTTEPSVEELEQDFNAPTVEHPLGERETNVSRDSTPKDSEPTANTPKDTSQGGGGKQAVKEKVDKTKTAVAKKVVQVAAANPYARAALIAAQIGAKTINALRRPEQVLTRVEEIARNARSFGKKVLIVILIIALILLFIIAPAMNMMTNQASQSNQTTSAPALQVTKSGPTAVAKGGNITYTINVSYAGSATNVTVLDPLPAGTNYVSSNPKGVSNGTDVTWDAKSLGLPLNNPINLTFTITIKAPNQDTYIINQASATVVGGSGGSGSGTVPNNIGNVPANGNTCSGIYAYYMGLMTQYGALSRMKVKIPGLNYGDPQCNLLMKNAHGAGVINHALIFSALVSALKADGHFKKSPENEANALFNCVLLNESGFDPNAYNPKSTSALKSGTPGAFGLFQMNALGSNWASYDVGDVVWTLQITNAIKMRNYEGGWHGYWPSSYQGCLGKFGVN